MTSRSIPYCHKNTDVQTFVEHIGEIWDLWKLVLYVP